MDNKFRSKSEIADLLGIPRKTFVSYYTGNCQIANPDSRKKLFDLTGIESFKSEKPNKQEGGILKVWIDSVIDIKTKQKTLQESNMFNNSSRRPFLDIATELRNWFINQHQWKTKKEFADSIGISYSTMKKIFLGIREPKGNVKRKLYGITKLECLEDSQNHTIQQLQQITDRPKIEQVEPKIEQVEPKIEQVEPKIEQVEPKIEQVEPKIEQVEPKIEQVEPKVTDVQPKIEQVEPKIVSTLKHTKEFEINSGDDVDKLVNLFYLLAKALEPFKYGTSEQRKKVKDQLPPEDLGYVISFLKAMYDEDNFTDFMFFSEYHMKGDNSE